MSTEGGSLGGIRRPSWSELRMAFAREGFRPSKGLGQNFLRDPNLGRALVLDSEVARGDRVLEVGVGAGFLTSHLIEHGVEVLACEIDARLLRVARGWIGDPPGVRWIQGDVLQTKNRLAPEVTAALWKEQDWHLVSNLPYAIAGPLLACLARWKCPPKSMTVLVQRELAERFAARPGDGSYGALTARLGLEYDASLVREVPAHLFWPKPRVESAVARLVRARTRPSGLERDAFEVLVATLFQARRKGLRAGLAGRWGSERAGELCEQLGLDPRKRPGELGPEELWRLSETQRTGALPPA